MVVDMQIRIVNNGNVVVINREDAVKLRDQLNAMFPLDGSSGGWATSRLKEGDVFTISGSSIVNPLKGIKAPRRK